MPSAVALLSRQPLAVVILYAKFQFEQLGEISLRSKAEDCLLFRTRLMQPLLDLSAVALVRAALHYVRNPAWYPTRLCSYYVRSYLRPDTGRPSLQGSGVE
jgi:hypothetical protein